MPTIDSTLSGASANSYVTSAGADSYFDNLLSYAAWASVDADDKTRALITATQAIDTLSFWGEAYSLTQALQFPRTLSRVSDGLSLPLEVRAATCELALHLAEQSASGSNSDRRASLQSQGVTSYRLGDLSETFGGVGIGASSGSSGALSQMPPVVQRLLSGWVKASFSSNSGRNYDGTGNYDSNGQWWPEPLL